jgi:hypothetical protein
MREGSTHSIPVNWGTNTPRWLWWMATSRVWDEQLRSGGRIHFPTHPRVSLIVTSVSTVSEKANDVILADGEA